MLLEEYSSQDEEELTVITAQTNKTKSILSLRYEWVFYSIKNTSMLVRVITINNLITVS